MESNANNFDLHADGYQGGMEDPLKRLAGASLDSFLRIKAEYLLRTLSRHHVAANQNLSILDYGCGTGDFLAILANSRPMYRLHGCDPSRKMLDQASRILRSAGSGPALLQMTPGTDLPYADASMDAITVVCVLHHIPPAERPAVMQRLGRLLKPGGLLCIFEHNPWNPVTRLVVSRAPIDADAVLLSAPEAEGLIRGCGGTVLHSRYLIVLPPRYRFFRRLDPMLSWLPLGAQYMTVGRR